MAEPSAAAYVLRRSVMATAMLLLPSPLSAPLPFSASLLSDLHSGSAHVSRLPALHQLRRPPALEEENDTKSCMIATKVAWWRRARTWTASVPAASRRWCACGGRARRLAAGRSTGAAAAAPPPKAPPVACIPANEVDGRACDAAKSLLSKYIWCLESL